MMKPCRSAVVLFALTAIAACGPARSSDDWQVFTATAYAVDGITSSGRQTVEGRTVAADPAVLPEGTRIEVTDAGAYSGTYVVHDTGPKVRGRQIDIFIADTAEATEFGRKQVRVRILAQPEQQASNAERQ